MCRVHSTAAEWALPALQPVLACLRGSRLEPLTELNLHWPDASALALAILVAVEKLETARQSTTVLIDPGPARADFNLKLNFELPPAPLTQSPRTVMVPVPLAVYYNCATVPEFAA